MSVHGLALELPAWRAHSIKQPRSRKFNERCPCLLREVPELLPLLYEIFQALVSSNISEDRLNQRLGAHLPNSGQEAASIVSDVLGSNLKRRIKI
jgi:hypothetical protein